MKLWITGSKGLVAAAVQRECLRQGIDHVSTSHDVVDIASPHQIRNFLHTHAAKNITHIINCAAYTQVDQAEHEPEKAHLVNAIGPENLAIVAHHFDLKLLHLSSDYVFGPDGSRPFQETDACQPLSIYAKTKHEGEKRLLDVYPSGCVLRTSWIFGKGGKNFLSYLLEKIQHEEKISVVSDQKNRPTYVDDLAKAILSLLCHSGIFHFANRGETSRFEMAQKLVEMAHLAGFPVRCREVIPITASSFSQGAKRPAYSALDTSKIEALLGFQARPWELALEDFFHAV